MTTLREACQQALEALELARDYAEGERLENERRYRGHEHLAPDDAYAVGQIDNAITALRAALAEQDDDLTAAWMAGAAEGRKRAEQAQPVAWTVKDDGLYWTVVPRYTTPPSPQRLTDEEILLVVGWERAEMYMKLTPNFPVEEARKETLKNARAVEAEVLKRMGVQR